jgi:hypothetical protein
LGSKGAIFFHCASVSNGPDRAIGPPSALLTLLISHFQKFNHSHFNGLSQVVQQLLVISLEIPVWHRGFGRTGFSLSVLLRGLEKQTG